MPAEPKEKDVAIGSNHAMSFSTASWMGDLSAFISGRTLHELRIPGSHNSGSDVLRDGVAPGEPLVYAAVPCIIRGWSECQVECVSEQLRAGCRYIDLRTAAVKGKHGLRIVHGLVGSPVLDVLEQVILPIPLPLPLPLALTLTRRRRVTRRSSSKRCSSCAKGSMTNPNWTQSAGCRRVP